MSGAVNESAHMHSSGHGAGGSDTSDSAHGRGSDSNHQFEDYGHGASEHGSPGGGGAHHVSPSGDEGLGSSVHQTYSGHLIEVEKPDPHADLLAQRLGGEPRVRFSNDPAAREFDAVSKDYIAQAKPSTVQVNQSFRLQAKATFGAAAETGRSVYYHFEGGPPSSDVVRRLQGYADRYGVDLVIDDTPLGG
jgi:hypothetical protein